MLRNQLKKQLPRKRKEREVDWMGDSTCRLCHIFSNRDSNWFLTGVEVSNAMVHSGPCPASRNLGAMSVGTLAIRRCMCPVCNQNIPDELVFAWV